jgi:hypothetical protein
MALSLHLVCVCLVDKCSQHIAGMSGMLLTYGDHSLGILTQLRGLIAVVISGLTLLVVWHNFDSSLIQPYYYLPQSWKAAHITHSAPILNSSAANTLLQDPSTSALLKTSNNCSSFMA